MGSDYCNPSKPHYDISMSKRTRKPLKNLQKDADQSPKKVCFLEKESPTLGGHDNKEEEEVEENYHRSLKQLITKGGSTSLGQHFTEEDLDAVKFKRIVISRYARVLSHLIRVKWHPRLGSRKKPALRLTL